MSPATEPTDGRSRRLLVGDCRVLRIATLMQVHGRPPEHADADGWILRKRDGNMWRPHVAATCGAHGRTTGWRQRDDTNGRRRRPV